MAVQRLKPLGHHWWRAGSIPAPGTSELEIHAVDYLGRPEMLSRSPTVGDEMPTDLLALGP